MTGYLDTIHEMSATINVRYLTRYMPQNKFQVTSYHEMFNYHQLPYLEMLFTRYT